MGTFRVTLEIGGVAGQNYQGVQALVDSGVAYTWIPASILQGLDLQPSFQLPFVLADGRVVERDLTETRVRLNRQVRTTLVIFGDDGTDALLGAYTLEGCGLMVDPVNKQLVPVPQFPMANGQRSC